MKTPHIALLLLAVTVWGLNFVFVQIGLKEVPPIFFCFLRSFLISMPTIWFLKRPTTPMKMVALYGFVMFVVQFSLGFIGMKMGVSAGLAAILMQTQVFFSILTGALFLKEKVDRWQVFGAITSFSGIALVGFSIQATASGLGLCTLLLSAAVWGSGSLIVKKMGKTRSTSLLSWSCMFAWPPLLALSLFFEDGYSTLTQLHNLSTPSYLAIAFITLGSTAFSFSVWNWLVQIYPLTTVSPFTLLIPIVAIITSSIFLGEPLQSWKLFAAGLVISGLCMNLIGTRNRQLEPNI